MPRLELGDLPGTLSSYTRTEQHRGSIPRAQIKAAQAVHQSHLRDAGLPRVPILQPQDLPVTGCPCSKTEHYRGLVHLTQTRAPGLFFQFRRDLRSVTVNSGAARVPSD